MRSSLGSITGRAATWYGASMVPSLKSGCALQIDHDHSFMFTRNGVCAQSQVRKLVLVGMLVLAGRGSVAQLFLAVCVSCTSLVLQVHLQPYKHPEDNAFKTSSEVHIFLVSAPGNVWCHTVGCPFVSEGPHRCNLVSCWSRW